MTRIEAPDKQQRSLRAPGEHEQNIGLGLDACTCYACGKDCFAVSLTKLGVLETYYQLSPGVTSIHSFRGSLSLPIMSHRHHSMPSSSPASGKPSFPQAMCCGQNSPSDSSSFTSSPSPCQGFAPYQAPFSTFVPNSGATIPLTSKHSSANPSSI